MAELRPVSARGARARRARARAPRRRTAGRAGVGARGARRCGAHPGRVDRPAASAVLRVHRILGARDRRDRGPACPHVRHQPGRRRARGHADRAPGRAVGERVRRLPGHDRCVHQRRDHQQRDRARCRQGAGAAGRTDRGLVGAPADRLLLGRGALLDHPGRGAAGHRLEQPPRPADRRCPSPPARRAGRSARSRHRRRHPAGRRRGHRRHHADGRDRSDRRDRGCLCRARCVAPRGRRVRDAGRVGADARVAVPRHRARRLGLGRRPQVAVPAEGMRGGPGARARDADAGVRARAGLPAAPAVRAARGGHHARVLAAVPGAEAVARVPSTRGAAVPRGDRPEPARGGPALPHRVRGRRLRDDERAAAALDRADPARAGRRRRPGRPQRRAREGDPAGRPGVPGVGAHRRPRVAAAVLRQLPHDRGRRAWRSSTWHASWVERIASGAGR